MIVEEESRILFSVLVGSLPALLYRAIPGCIGYWVPGTWIETSCLHTIGTFSTSSFPSPQHNCPSIPLILQAGPSLLRTSLSCPPDFELDTFVPSTSQLALTHTMQVRCYVLHSLIFFVWSFCFVFFFRIGDCTLKVLHALGRQ